jgi:hypothetical protein
LLVLAAVMQSAAQPHLKAVRLAAVIVLAALR